MSSLSGYWGRLSVKSLDGICRFDLFFPSGNTVIWPLPSLKLVVCALILYSTKYSQVKKQTWMENIWMHGQRSALQWCSLGPVVQTEESLDSDAWLSQREGAGVSADINPPPSTSTPQFQPQCLPRFGVKEGPLGEEAGASCSGRACWKSHHTVTFELGWLWHSSRIQLQGRFNCNHMTQQNLPTWRQMWHIWILQLLCLDKTLPRPHISINKANKAISR